MFIKVENYFFQVLKKSISSISYWKINRWKQTVIVQVIKSLFTTVKKQERSQLRFSSFQLLSFFTNARNFLQYFSGRFVDFFFTSAFAFFSVIKRLRTSSRIFAEDYFILIFRLTSIFSHLFQFCAISFCKSSRVWLELGVSKISYHALANVSFKIFKHARFCRFSPTKITIEKFS